jgi:hypothetical protein
MQTRLHTIMADRAAYANAPTTTMSPRMGAWIAANPAAYDWLIDNCDSFDFAASLLSSLRKWGSLTPNQLAAVQRILVKRQIQADRHAAAPAVSLAPVESAFDKAKAAGIKYPKLRLDVFTFSPASATSKNAGAVYVKEGDTYLGKVLGGKLFAVSACTPQQEQAIVAVAADPAAAAIAYGKRFGKCSVCARTLSDADSINRGIGPVCATRFGW